MKKAATLIILNLLFHLTIVNNSNTAEISNTCNGWKVEITIDGTIENRDYNKFINEAVWARAKSKAIFEVMVTQNENKKIAEELISKYGTIKGLADVTVLINSNGGDSLESMKIGKAISEMAMKTSISEINEKKSKCLSSCLFIWASGVERSVSYNEKSNSIGIHRVFYNPKYFKELSSIEAEDKYREAISITESFLKEMRIPKNITEKIFNVPSNQLYWLTSEEINSLEGMAPYFEELLISKCGSYTKEEETDYLDCNIVRVGMKDGKFSYLPTIVKEDINNKCNKLSSGYLSYLEKKYRETKICQSTNGNIERWKRMEKYLSPSLISNILRKQ